MTARYLLRFDDICPTMNWHVWDQLEGILSTEGISPILAVVPDNQDEVLRVSPPHSRFWERVRGWQTRGWTIGMHGYQHRYGTSDAGILGVNTYSEFAGLPVSKQKRKLQAGVSILRQRGIQSKLWIAPAHSFDNATIQALRELGFTHLSDGFFSVPHVDEFGMTWIPQQLWSFRRRPFGVWTVCFHVNRWTERDISKFKESVLRFREAISSFDTVAAAYRGRRKTRTDVLAGRVYRSATVAAAAKRPLRTMRTLRESLSSLRQGDRQIRPQG